MIAPFSDWLVHLTLDCCCLLWLTIVVRRAFCCTQTPYHFHSHFQSAMKKKICIRLGMAWNIYYIDLPGAYNTKDVHLSRNHTMNFLTPHCYLSLLVGYQDQKTVLSKLVTEYVHISDGIFECCLKMNAKVQSLAKIIQHNSLEKELENFLTRQQSKCYRKKCFGHFFLLTNCT